MKKIGFDINMWTCEKCGREFSRKTWHSCVIYNVEDHLKKASPEIRKAFKSIISELKKLGKLRVDAVKTYISLGSRVFFGCIYIRNSSLQIDFISPRKLHSPRLSKSVFGQKNYYNTIRITSLGEVDTELLNWLKEAMFLAS